MTKRKCNCWLKVGMCYCAVLLSCNQEIETECVCYNYDTAGEVVAVGRVVSKEPCESTGEDRNGIKTVCQLEIKDY